MRKTVKFWIWTDIVLQHVGDIIIRWMAALMRPRKFRSNQLLLLCLNSLRLLCWDKLCLLCCLTAWQHVLNLCSWKCLCIKHEPSKGNQLTDSYLIRATNHFSDGPRRCHQRVRRLEWPVHMPASTDMTCIVPAIGVRHHSKGVQRTGDIYCCRTQHGNNSEQMRVDETKWIQGSIGMIDVLRYNCSTMISLEFISCACMNTQENPAKSNIFFSWASLRITITMNTWQRHITNMG